MLGALGTGLPPKPFKGTMAIGAFGIWSLPALPEAASDRQALDYASVLGAIEHLSQYRESYAGTAAVVDRIVLAYLRAYYPADLEARHHSFTEVLD